MAAINTAKNSLSEKQQARHCSPHSGGNEGSPEASPTAPSPQLPLPLGLLETSCAGRSIWTERGRREATGTDSWRAQRADLLRMDFNLLLGLACLCSPLTALVLDFNTIRSSAEVDNTKKSGHCVADKDCPAGKFCHKPWEEMPICVACRGVRKRCHRNAMCCPGMLCLNDVCSMTEKVTLAEERKQVEASSPDVLQHPIAADQALKHGSTQVEGDQATAGENCLRTSDCAAGLCCARHFWAKICKPVLTEGQVCSRRGGQKEGSQGPEIFQRCNCGPGLSCQLPARGMPQRARLRVCRKN